MSQPFPYEPFFGVTMRHVVLLTHSGTPSAAHELVRDSDTLASAVSERLDSVDNVRALATLSVRLAVFDSDRLKRLVGLVREGEKAAVLVRVIVAVRRGFSVRVRERMSERVALSTPL